jgi:23S rRNA (cytosine1962-C5)-methyltransferase
VRAAIENSCHITRKGFHWARTGHPWIYRDDVAEVSGTHGEVVRVCHEGRCLGSAFLSTRSKIALRWIERADDPFLPDEEFWHHRLWKAARAREALALKTSAWRLVHDSADGIPGLVVDRYGPVAVLQTTIAGTEKLIPFLSEDLPRVLGVEAVVARNDVTVREKEGLPLESRVLRGECPELVWVHDDGPLGRVEFPVDPLRGQKTGAYLDQRGNRWRAAELASGRFLDAFSHTGLFSLHAARKALELTAVDTSDWALGLCEKAAERAGITKIHAVRQNVFEYLKEASAREEKFETIVLDPPAFAKSRGEVPAAVRGYREINRRAMSLLSEGGVLVTCSCSYNLSEEGFLDVLRGAAADARAELRVEERRTQDSDHPILLCHPESAYLKCVILRKLG